jgi:hypothetical protein
MLGSDRTDPLTVTPEAVRHRDEGTPGQRSSQPCEGWTGCAASEPRSVEGKRDLD